MIAPARPAAAAAAWQRWRPGGAGSAATPRSPAGGTRPPSGLRNRLREWWLARHPQTDTWTLNQRNIYILPTKGGWAFGLTLLVMLLSAINYQLNLGEREDGECRDETQRRSHRRSLFFRDSKKATSSGM